MVDSLGNGLDSLWPPGPDCRAHQMNRRHADLSKTCLHAEVKVWGVYAKEHSWGI